MTMAETCCTKNFNKIGVLLISSLLFGLTGCSDSQPTSSVEQDLLLKSQAVQLEVDQLDGVSLTSAVTPGKLIEQPQFELEQGLTELDQSVLKSLSKLSQVQDRTMEANSVKELEQLSEADRQALQAIAAQQTMAAAEQLASKQVDNSEPKRAVD